MAEQSQSPQSQSKDTELIESYLKSMDLNPESLRKAPNIWMITQNEVEIFMIAAGGFLILQSKVMGLPKSNQSTFYRKLLELNDNVEESLGAAFGINKNNEIILKMLRPMTNIGLKEFIYYLTSITFVAEKQSRLLKERFNV